ncbi:MAG: hypothetical protein GY760_16820 [Deltaproteobacteria bacterium]|nr:hypothetical protein [Deltaproteobacteria bacterium]
MVTFHITGITELKQLLLYFYEFRWAADLLSVRDVIRESTTNLINPDEVIEVRSV